MPSARLLYRRAGGFLCLAQESLEDWTGDAIVTSTNRHLEGTIRRNWWGFTGRRSADAALHARAGDFLVNACRAQVSQLRFGDVVVTDAGPNLQAFHVLHTAVPNHPAGRDPRPLPKGQAEDYVGVRQAEALLSKSYTALLQVAEELRVESLCLPAIGCGCRGYPSTSAAHIGLGVLLAHGSHIPYVEVRFWDQNTFSAWNQECNQLGLSPCIGDDAARSGWGPEHLAARFEQKKRKASGYQCPLQ